MSEHKYEMRRDLLAQLADHLDTVDPDTFDMEVWRRDEPLRSCGFAGCAIGHAVGLPGFEDLKLARSYDDALGYYPIYGFDTHMDAVRSFFGISLYDALRLFDPTFYDTVYDVDDVSVISPKMVASKIRGFIAHEQPSP